MLGYVTLKLVYELLRRISCRIGILYGAELRHYVHKPLIQLLPLCIVTFFILLLKLPVLRSIAVGFLCLSRVLIYSGRIECLKTQISHSYRFYSTGEVDQIVKMLPLQLKQLYLLFKSFPSVEARAVHDTLYLLQRKFQLAEKQYSLKPLQRRIVIQPVPGPRHLGGLQQPYSVVIMQRAHAHTGQFANFLYRLHLLHTSRANTA